MMDMRLSIAPALTPDVDRDRFTQTLQRLTTEVERLERVERRRRRMAGRPPTNPPEQADAYPTP